MKIDRTFRKQLLYALTRHGKASQKGLTLMESLVAIVMIAAVSVTITPPIFLAVATRVQNRKAEQALQLANGQVDQVRVLMEQGISDEKQLPENAGVDTAAAVPAPTAAHGDLQSTNFECSAYDKNYEPKNPTQVLASEGLPVDVDGDCTEDFFVQMFRINDQFIPGNDDIPVLFRLGVRVYASNADFGSLETEQAALKLTTGEGQQTSRPLATLYTDMGQSDIEGSLRQYHELLK
ncbi:MAG: type II secretion system protein [Cyanobacteriota bacterium]|nr:type II secretion system protein [Cyanobacteriota bacterium]